MERSEEPVVTIWGVIAAASRCEDDTQRVRLYVKESLHEIVPSESIASFTISSHDLKALSMFPVGKRVRIDVGVCDE